jgi:hypothetical protein
MMPDRFSGGTRLAFLFAVSGAVAAAACVGDEPTGSGSPDAGPDATGGDSASPPYDSSAPDTAGGQDSAPDTFSGGDDAPADTWVSVPEAGDDAPETSVTMDASDSSTNMDASDSSPVEASVPEAGQPTGASLIMINSGASPNILVAPSTGSSFGMFTQWLGAAFWGNITTGPATIAGDVDGDGKADLVGIPTNYEVYVTLSSGSAFGTPTRWTSAAWYGATGTFVGDVTGDGKADLVALDATAARVRPSNGTLFAPEQSWITGITPGDKVNLLGDMNGDGKADLVLISTGSISVALSTGSSFAAPVAYLAGAFYGELGTYAGDINGDGKDDLIGVDKTYELYVTQSFGTSLGAPLRGLPTAFYGANTTIIADVDGDKKVDVIAVDAAQVRVALSTGNFTSTAVFQTPSVWFPGMAAGSQATLAAKVR